MTQTMDLTPGSVADTAAARVDIREPAARFSLRLGTEGVTAISAALGLTLPARIGARTRQDGREALRLGPDEWLMLAPAAEAETVTTALSAIYPATPHSLTEISDREITVQVEGPQVLSLLAMGCPRDLAILPVGEGRRTLFDGVTVVLWRDGETRFRLDVWRSHAPHLLELLALGCAELAV